MAALGCYALDVRLGEGRRPSELALGPARSGLAVGAALEGLMIAALMGLLIVTGLYELTPVGSAPAWTGTRSGRAGGCDRGAVDAACCSGCSGERSSPSRPSPVLGVGRVWL